MIRCEVVENGGDIESVKLLLAGDGVHVFRVEGASSRPDRIKGEGDEIRVWFRCGSEVVLSGLGFPGESFGVSVTFPGTTLMVVWDRKRYGDQPRTLWSATDGDGDDRDESWRDLNSTSSWVASASGSPGR